MTTLDCDHKWARHVVHKKTLRCGTCVACQTLRRLEWVSRLRLEAATHPRRPWFVTLTYARVPLETSLTRNVALFVMRLRKMGLHPRYFVVAERGGKHGRLHHHMIVWFAEPFELWRSLQRLLEERWGHGFVSYCSPVRDDKGLRYVSKYILKGGLGYQWSMKPQLGKPGLLRWRAQAMAMHQIKPFETVEQVPVFLNANVLNKACQIRIPNQDVRRLCKELGVQYAPDNTNLYANQILTGVPTGPLDVEMLKLFYGVKLDMQLTDFGQFLGEHTCRVSRETREVRDEQTETPPERPTAEASNCSTTRPTGIRNS